MIQHPSQRVGVFIDVQNMYYSARNVHNAKVSFGEVVSEGVGDRHLIRAIAYVVRTKTGEEKAFLDALYHQGIETREKEIQEFFGGAKKADWDVGIAVDAIRIADLLDVVVLVSGDGDFVPLVEYLKGRGRQVELMSFRETTSSKLLDVVDIYTDLSASQEVFLIKDASTGTGSRTTRSTKSKISDDKPAVKDKGDKKGKNVIIRAGKKIPIK